MKSETKSYKYYCAPNYIIQKIKMVLKLTQDCLCSVFKKVCTTKLSIKKKIKSRQEIISIFSQLVVSF